MQSPNENGVYPVESTEELARKGRSFAAIELCQCDDGLYRYALQIMYTIGGMGGPITRQTEGFATYQAAKYAGAVELLRRLPTARPSDPIGVVAELRELKTQIERDLREPTLF